MFEKRDGTLPCIRTASHLAIYRDRTKKRDQYQHYSRNWRQDTSGQQRDSSLIGNARKVIHSSQPHHCEPGVLWARLVFTFEGKIATGGKPSQEVVFASFVSRFGQQSRSIFKGVTSRISLGIATSFGTVEVFPSHSSEGGRCSICARVCNCNVDCCRELNLKSGQYNHNQTDFESQKDPLTFTASGLPY